MATNQEYSGRIDYYDLSTTDMPSAIDFYTKVIGWEAVTWDNPDMPYTTFKAAVGCVAGAMPLPEHLRAMNVPPHWMAYVTVADPAETCAKATELGGKVVLEPMLIPNVGTIAVLSDPQGACIALYTSLGDAFGHENRKGHGEVTWHELATSDYEAAFNFYEKLFGWNKKSTMDMGPECGGIYLCFGRDDKTVGGMFNTSQMFPGPSRWVIYFNVDDIDATIARVKEHGGTVRMDVMEVPGGEFAAQCVDPQGAEFALHAYTRK